MSLTSVMSKKQDEHGFNMRAAAKIISSLDIEGAVIIVDKDLTILGLNQDALMLLRAKTLVYSLGSALRFMVKDIHCLVAKEVFTMSQSEQRGLWSRIIRGSGPTWLLRLYRISGWLEKSVLPLPSAVVVSIVNMNICQATLDTILLKSTYHLSNTELSLCEALFGGMRLKDAADHCGISYEHARQRLKVILQKTNTSSQIELNKFLSKLKSQL